MNAEELQFETLIAGLLTDGYAVFDNYLSITEVADLSSIFKERFDNGQFKQAGIGNAIDLQNIETIRNDKIVWIQHDTVVLAEINLLSKNQSFINYLNSTCYLGIKDSEFHFAKYEKNKYYKRHYDSFQYQKNRVISIIYYLNTNWVPIHGGELVIYPSNLTDPIKIAPISGRMVCFDSEKIAHEVLVTHKERLSIAGWLLR